MRELKEGCVYAAVGERARWNELVDPFEQLASNLREIAQKHDIIYIRNPGNLGDGLIAFATREFFADYAIPFQEVRLSRKSEKVSTALRGLLSRLGSGRPRCLVYGGGGAWCDAYEHGYRIVGQLAPFFHKVVVLPSTFEGRVHKKNHIQYCWRDQFQSKEFMLASGVNGMFCHDMAFYLMCKEQSFFTPHRSTQEKGFGRLFRTDREGRYMASLTDEDLSADGDADDSVPGFLRAIDGYDPVATDRLHVSIGATLLGKSVFLVRGSYFKIEAIYKSSMLGFYQNSRPVEDSTMSDMLAQAQYA